MTRLPKVLVKNLQLTTSYATEYTAPTLTTTTIAAFTLNNTTATPATVSISLVPSGGSQAAANELVTELSIAAKTSVAVPQLVAQSLEAGATLQMKASTGSAITPYVSGYETQ